jgi:outer membrane protein W
MKVRDYKGNSLQIGFDNEVHFREFVTVEDGIVNINTTQTNNDQKSKKQKVPLDENSKHNQNELSEKNVLTPKKKLDELRNKKDSKFKDKGKNLNKIEDVLEFIQRLPFSEANAKKLEKKMESLSFGDKNIIRMKWQNLLKPKKKKIVKKDDPSIKTNITKVNKNESPRLEISIVSGNKGDMYLIRSLIKEYLIDKNQNNIQVISLK